MEKSIDEQLMERAMKDPEFRKNLIANPKATLEKEYKITLPAGVAVQVHEDSSTTRHVVLPKAQMGGVELSDAELSTAAGGMRPADGARGSANTCPCCTCGVSTHQTIFSK